MKIVKELEFRIRTSREYHLWAKRNRAPSCFLCHDASEIHNVHHVTSLYHICLGALRMYATLPKAYAHVISLHINDMVDNLTLCERCHNETHPRRTKRFYPDTSINVGPWCVIPRKHDTAILPRPRREHDPEHAISPFAFQVLLGIGWNILNGNVQNRILDFNLRHFARLIGKTPGKSATLATTHALAELESCGILDAHIAFPPEGEVHISKDYLKTIGDNPWFFALKDVSSRVPVATHLKLILSFDGGKKQVSYAPFALAEMLNMTYRRPSEFIESVKHACAEIPWANVHSTDKKRIVFKIARRGAVPIHSLRRSLQDALDYAE